METEENRFFLSNDDDHNNFFCGNSGGDSNLNILLLESVKKKIGKNKKTHPYISM